MRALTVSMVAGLVLALAGCGKVVSSQSVLATAKIGPEGGTISLGAIRIEIPPGALVERTTVSIQLVVAPPAGNVGPAYKVDAGGAELLLPAAIFYTVDAADLPEGTAVGDVRLAWVEDGAWTELPGCQMNEKAGVVQGQTTHFSLWGAIPSLLPIPCSTAADCPEIECMVASCDKGGCAYAADPACEAADVADSQDQDGMMDVPDILDQEGAEASEDVCAPGCEGKQCGDDGCGGSCGECWDGLCQGTCADGVCSFLPQGPEVCDGLDNDCDGLTDQELGTTSCGVGVCLHVQDNCKEGKPQVCDPMHGAAAESCDGLDNDCDGLTDEELDGLKAELDTACQAYKDNGVCAAALDKLNTKCSVKPGGMKGFVCDLSHVPDYVAEEKNKPEWCDSLDNDCDGTVDEDILLLTVPDIQKYNAGCLTQGICAKGTLAICEPKDPPEAGKANWQCDYSQVKDFAMSNWYDPAANAYREVMCDGIDNDCDGFTDEELDQDFGPLAGDLSPKEKSGCSFQGYCAVFMKWSCKNEGGASKWVCDGSTYPKYEIPEKSCDGEDNDCDGKTDEELTDPGPEGADCKSGGVCSKNVFAECQKGPPPHWICHYNAVAGYDGTDEKTCDGLDNDCDGLTDEELDEKKTWKETGACKTVGVCGSPNLQATCQGKFGWECWYALLAPEGWEADEKLCDGQDNDCDGATDELTCGCCEPCNDFTNCQSGACLETPLGDKYCSLGKNYCVYVDPNDGQCATVPAQAGKGCKDTTQPCLCGGGDGGADAFWFCDGVLACSGATPFCYQGECKTCIPDKMKCDGNVILMCSIDGNAWKTYGICGGTQICLGEGKCVSNEESKVNIKAISTTPGEYNPKVAGLVGGGFVVVYHANQPTGGALTDVMARLYDYQWPLASEYIVNLPGVAGYQENPDVASFPNADGGFVVVWESSVGDGDGWDIVGQRFLNNGIKQGDTFLVNSDVAMDQRRAEVATLYDGSFLVAWEHSFAGVDAPDVRAQLFNNKTEKSGPEKTLNSYVTNQQRTPVVAALDKEGWIAAWASLGQVDNYDIIARRYDSTLAEIGGEAQANLYTLSAQKRPAIGGLLGTYQGGFVVAWESFGQDTPTSSGVFAQVFTKNGPAKQPVDILCNAKYLAGSQKDPELAVLKDSSFVVVWESSDVDGDGDAVMARVFDATGNALTVDELMVNQTVPGNQNNPAVAALEGGGYVVVWTNWTTVGGTSTYDIYARLFDAP